MPGLCAVSKERCHLLEAEHEEYEGAAAERGSRHTECFEICWQGTALILLSTGGQGAV